MELASLIKFMLAVMFSPPGIANFIISTLLKKRLYASIAALIAASALFMMQRNIFSKMTTGYYTLSVVFAVVAMLIVSHVAYTVGEKIIRSKKK